MESSSAQRNASLQKILDNTMDFCNQMPDIMFIKTVDSEFVECNQSLVDFSKLDSKQAIIQNRDENLPWAANAEFNYAVDQQVLAGKVSRLVKSAKISTGEKRFIFQKKFRLCDEENQPVGIVAIMQTIHDKKIIDSLQKLFVNDIKIQVDGDYPEASYEISENYAGYNFSLRESQCLFYLLRGMTAKEIGKVLKISNRTVEVHLNNIKTKFNCHSKHQIVSKALENKFLYIIPKGINIIN